MTPCRAKMIDGTPVTFDWIDHGLQRAPEYLGGDCYIAEYLGLGLHVLSTVPRHVGMASISDVDKHHRRALERSGVDTATAERQDEFTGFSSMEGGHVSMKRWVPLFPPMLKNEPVSILPGSITFAPRAKEPTRDMLDAGADALYWAQYRKEGLRDIVSAVWRAMENARR